MRSHRRSGPGRKDGAVYLKLAPLLIAAVILAVHGGSSNKHQALLGNQRMMPALDQNAPGRAEAFAFIARSSGRVTEARVFVAKGSHAGRLVVGIYKSATGRGPGAGPKPGSLLSSGTIAFPGPGRWNAVPLRSTRLKKGVGYWIALLGVHGRLSFRDSPSGSTTYGSRQTRLVTLPRSFTPGPTWKSGPASVYVMGSVVKSSSGSTGTGSLGGTGSTSGSPGSVGTPGGGTPQACSGLRNAPGGSDPFGGCFPGPNNTGVPPGTGLQNVPAQVTSGPGWSWSASDGVIYVTGCGAVLNSLNVAGSVVVRASATNGAHTASSPCVTIENSLIQGFVDNGLEYPNVGPLVMTDDTINVPSGDNDRAPVLMSNYYAWRLNVEGGRLGFACSGYCEIHDSWIHDGYLSGSFHYNGIGTNGTGGAPLVMDHDSIACSFGAHSGSESAAGCTADVGLLGDFGTISNITINKNLLVSTPNQFENIPGPPYCLVTNNPKPGKKYPQAANEVVTDNVFQRGQNGKCGLYGAVDIWTSGNGNVWSGNTWDDGSTLRPGG